MFHTEIVHKIRGNPQLIEERLDSIKSFSLDDWKYLLHHRPNTDCIVSRCDRWMDFNVDDLCELLVEHPGLCNKCPPEVWGRFCRGHWAKLISGDHVYSEKFSELGLKSSMAPEWCCPDHWAKAYATVFKVTLAAAIPEDLKIERIAMNSAFNPQFDGGSPLPFGDDKIGYSKWVASIAQDLVGMAQIAASNGDVMRAEQYALIAKAANYAITAYLK